MRVAYLVTLAMVVLVATTIAVLLRWPHKPADNNSVAENEPTSGKPDGKQDKEVSESSPEPKYDSKSLEQWLGQLRTGNAKQRTEAATALANGVEPKDTAAIEPLIGALKDQEQHVRSQVAKALGRFGPRAKNAIPDLIEVDGGGEALADIGPVAIPALIQALNNRDPRICRQVTLALGKMGPAARAALPVLVEIIEKSETPLPISGLPHSVGDGLVLCFLNDYCEDEKWTRAYATEAIGKIGAEAQHIPLLLKALHDWDSTIRFMAARALGKIGPAAKEAVPALIDALDDKEVQYTAAEALAAIGPSKEAVPALTRVLTDRDDALTHGEATKALGKIGPDAKAAVPTLIEMLQNKKKEHERGTAARALGKIGVADKHVLPALIEALDDEKTLGDAAAALGDIGPAAAEEVPLLAKKYNELANKKRSYEDSIAADGIISGLRGIGGPGIVCLADIYQSGDFTNTNMAAKALEELGPKAEDAVPTLIETMKRKSAKDEQTDWRWQTAAILAKIGPKAKAAVPALLEAAKDPDLSVRHTAAHALYEIDPQAAERAGVPEPPMHSQIFINSDRSPFDKDELGALSGPAIGGTALLWVNGDPVEFFEGGGEMFSIHPWLQRGKNEISLSGKHDNPVYIVVANHYALHFLGMAGKKEFDGPGSDEQAEPLVYRADKVPNMPQREELSARPEDRKRYEAEIRAVLNKLKELIEAHDGDKAAGQLSHGSDLWRKAYGISDKDMEEETKALAKALSDTKLRVIDEEAPMRLIFGKRVVMAYVDRPKEAEDGPHLLTVEIDGKRTGIDHLHLTRIGGEWVMWDEPDGLTITLSLKGKD